MARKRSSRSQLSRAARAPRNIEAPSRTRPPRQAGVKGQCDDKWVRLEVLWSTGRRFPGSIDSGAMRRLHPAVIGIPAAFILLFGAWLTIHSAGNYSTCTGLGLFGPGDCGFYRNAAVVGGAIAAVGIGLGIWALVLVQIAASRKRSNSTFVDTSSKTPPARTSTPAAAPATAAPGWYPHPQRLADLAYWDGQAWTWEKSADGEAKPI
jgi:hypothetical protein